MKWSITEQGARVQAEVWRADTGDGLYKAYLVGSGGQFLLGTLMPEGGQLHLKRSLSLDSLKRQGAWPVQRVREELVCSFREPPQGILWEDDVLRRSARKLPPHLMQKNENGFTLSFPFDPCAPFPLTPAFCFARVENARLLFSFCENGSPYVPQGKGKHGGGTGHTP